MRITAKGEYEFAGEVEDAPSWTKKFIPFPRRILMNRLLLYVVIAVGILIKSPLAQIPAYVLLLTALRLATTQWWQERFLEKEKQQKICPTLHQ